MPYFRALIGGIFAALLLSAGTFALDVPPKPPLERPIVDTTSTLTSGQIDALATLINQTRQEKAYQIGILMVPALENRALEEYSLDVARAWGIGDTTNNGVLLLVAKNDRLMRIEVGSGLEGDLTDAESGRIIRNVIAPQFRSGNYHEGIRQGVLSIKAQVEKTASADASAKQTLTQSAFEAFFPLVFIGTMVISWFGSLLARSRSWWAGGLIGGGIGGIVGLLAHWSLIGVLAVPLLAILGLLFDYFVSKNFYYKTANGDTPSWWAGGSWIDGSGGGFSGGGSFGGGGFSGGGSSGSSSGSW